MANTGDVSVGTVLRYNGELCQIVEWQHRTPGNLRAFYQGKMRNLKTGKLLENRFRSGERNRRRAQQLGLAEEPETRRRQH